MPAFGVVLVRIFPHSDWIRRDTPYLSVFSPNAGKYGPISEASENAHDIYEKIENPFREKILVFSVTVKIACSFLEYSLLILPGKLYFISGQKDISILICICLKIARAQIFFGLNFSSIFLSPLVFCHPKFLSPPEIFIF